jgi:hypothetical protein
MMHVGLAAALAAALVGISPVSAAQGGTRSRSSCAARYRRPAPRLNAGWRTTRAMPTRAPGSA